MVEEQQRRLAGLTGQRHVQPCKLVVIDRAVMTTRLAKCPGLQTHRKVIDQVVDGAAGGYSGTIGEGRPELLRPFKQRTQQAELFGSAVVGEIACCQYHIRTLPPCVHIADGRPNLALASTNCRITSRLVDIEIGDLGDEHRSNIAS